MLNIALCDDDSTFMKALRKKIENWFKTEEFISEKVALREFHSGRELLSSLQETAYDILFLDIEMPEMGGMEVAKEARAKLPWAIIMFLTSHSEFAPDGYRVQALRYLTKQTVDQTLGEAMTAAMKTYNQLETGTLTVVRQGLINRIELRDILYVRHLFRYSEIHTISQNPVRDSRGIKELHDAINNERFVFIDRGVFINLDHLQRIDTGKAILRNGEGLMISRRMMPELKKTVNRLLGG